MEGCEGAVDAWDIAGPFTGAGFCPGRFACGGVVVAGRDQAAGGGFVGAVFRIKFVFGCCFVLGLLVELSVDVVLASDGVSFCVAGGEGGGVAEGFVGDAWVC